MRILCYFLLSITLCTIFNGCGSGEDQTVLGVIAQEADESGVFIEGGKKLRSQALVFQIATEDHAWEVREAAAEKLEEQSMLAKLAVNSEDWNVRLIATNKLGSVTTNG